MTQTEPGAARSPGITYQELLDTDTHPVPDVLRLESPRYLGSEDVPAARYTSKEFHDLEVEKLWSRVWQYACREEEIPEVGDYYIYEIALKSYIVVRSAEDEIKAFPNACLHRGRQLKDYDGRCSELRCAFHGFAWELDGSLKDVPGRWDFPHVVAEDFELPEVGVGRWAGFIFINPNPGFEEFDDFIGEIREQFVDWDLENRYKQAHVAKIIHANWKIAQEAFCEAYHVNATHPQIMPYLGCTNSQVDVWDNCARVISPGGTVSPMLDYDVDPDDMMRAMLDIRHDQDLPFRIPEGASMRSMAAHLARERWAETAGEEWANTMSDAEMMDSIDYTIFPNMHPWGAFNRIVYRFRPNGDDQRSAIMECIFIAPYQGERPPPAEIHWLEEHETWTDAPELGMLGKVFDQDLFNMAKVQRGLESTHKPGVTLANYMESKVRWLHKRISDYVEAD